MTRKDIAFVDLILRSFVGRSFVTEREVVAFVLKHRDRRGPKYLKPSYVRHFADEVDALRDRIRTLETLLRASRSREMSDERIERAARKAADRMADYIAEDHPTYHCGIGTGIIAVAIRDEIGKQAPPPAKDMPVRTR